MKISLHLYLAQPKPISSLETIKNDRILIFSSSRMADKYRPAGWMCNGEAQQGGIRAWEEWALAESCRRYLTFMILHLRFVVHRANIYLLRINSTAIVIGIIIHIFNIEHGPVCHNVVVLASYHYPAARRCGKHQTKQRGKRSIISNT
jgi:hypothetical protein